MNISQYHFAPQHVPTQMENPALQNQEPPSFVGKVIRFSPSNYAFVCDYCMAQHQSIGSFLLHSELHFQRNEISIVMPSTPVCSTQNTSTAPTQPAGTSSNANGSAVPPYPVQLQHSTPMNQDTDEVYEIIDLGYDFEGIKYPNAKHIDQIVPQNNKKPTQHRPRPKSNNVMASGNENAVQKCPFCDRYFTNVAAMQRHMDISHKKIFKKIVCQKKAYKCKICDEKFPKSRHTLESAHEHLKIHYSH